MAHGRIFGGMRRREHGVWVGLYYDTNLFDEVSVHTFARRSSEENMGALLLIKILR